MKPYTTSKQKCRTPKVTGKKIETKVLKADELLDTRPSRDLREVTEAQSSSVEPLASLSMLATSTIPASVCGKHGNLSCIP